MPPRTRTTFLIVDGPAQGAWNMAADEVLLASAVAHDRQYLRFYGWERPTLSLGYFQALRQRQTHPSSEACPVVRRATGGGAILHDVELTYSFVATAGDRLANDVTRLYDAFHETLVETLGDWRVPAGRVEEEPASKAPASKTEEPFLCFQRRSRGDVLLGAAKIGGSAQRRQLGAVLQHGSILLQTSSWAPELPGIRELAGVDLTADQLRRAWTPRIVERLGISLLETDWSDTDLQEVEDVRRRRYASPSWTERR